MFVLCSWKTQWICAKCAVHNSKVKSLLRGNTVCPFNNGSQGNETQGPEYDTSRNIGLKLFLKISKGQPGREKRPK